MEGNMAYSDNNSHGFIQLIRSNEVENLIKQRPTAFLLLTLIAYRARRTLERQFNDLQVNEAFIGDHASYGATPRQYRTDKKILEKYNLATFRATNRGTIARLIDTTIFNINPEETTNQETTKRQSPDNQPTTNNNGKNDNNGIKRPFYQISGSQKRNPILEDPIFNRLMSVRGEDSDRATRLRMMCEPALNKKYPMFNFGREWNEANALLKSNPS
jgi:hypothetical protein